LALNFDKLDEMEDGTNPFTIVVGYKNSSDVIFMMFVSIVSRLLVIPNITHCVALDVNEKMSV